MSAAIEFVPGRFYLGIWYFDLPEALSEFGKGGNFLATLWRPDDSPTEWHFDYRFRHYRDERVWQHEDTINAVGGKFACSHEEIALALVQKAMHSIIHAAGDVILMFLEVRGDSFAALEKMKGLPMFHFGEEQKR